MKALKTILAVGVLMAIVGCAGPYSGGMVISDYKALNCSPDSAQGLTPGAKVGEATMINYMGLVAKGDASITKAAENGGIKKIQTVDYKYTSILGIINTTTTIVTGQ